MDATLIINQLLTLYASQLNVQRQRFAYPLQNRVIPISYGLPPHLFPISVAPTLPAKLQLSATPPTQAPTPPVQLTTPSYNFVGGSDNKVYFTKGNELISYVASSDGNVAKTVEITDPFFAKQKMTAFCDSAESLAIGFEGGLFAEIRKKSRNTPTLVEHLYSASVGNSIIHIAPYENCYLIVCKNGDIYRLQFLDDIAGSNNYKINLHLLSQNGQHPQLSHVLSDGIFIFAGFNDGSLRVFKYDERYSYLPCIAQRNMFSSPESITCLSRLKSGLFDALVVGGENGSCSLLNLDPQHNQRTACPIFWKMSFPSKITAFYSYDHFLFTACQNESLWVIDSRKTNPEPKKISEASEIRYMHALDKTTLLIGYPDTIKKLSLKNIFEASHSQEPHPERNVNNASSVQNSSLTFDVDEAVTTLIALQASGPPGATGAFEQPANNNNRTVQFPPPDEMDIEPVAQMLGQIRRIEDR